MGAEETRQIVCELGFDESRMMPITLATNCETKRINGMNLAALLERLKCNNKKIDIRSVEGNRISNTNLIDFYMTGNPIFLGFYGKPTRLYCKGHMLSIFPYNLREHFFGWDDEGRVVNMHGETVCTGCEYFLKGRKD